MTKNIWLVWASIISCLIIGAYVVLHVCSNKEGEKVSLSAHQLSTVSTIIGNSAEAVNGSEKNVKRLIVNYLEDALAMKNHHEVDEVVMSYPLHQLPAILPSYTFTTRSFFWLTGNWILVEVLFWSLFGLIANLMYKVAGAEKFDPKRVPEHIAKLFYTPIATLVVYLALSALVNEGSISLDGVSEHVVVLSFILGFFTERTIGLIGKIKDLILPTGAVDQPAKTTTGLSPEQIAQQAISDNENELNAKYPGLIVTMTVGTTSDNSIGILATLSETPPADFPGSLNAKGQSQAVNLEYTVQEPG